MKKHLFFSVITAGILLSAASTQGVELVKYEMATDLNADTTAAGISASDPLIAVNSGSTQFSNGGYRTSMGTGLSDTSDYFAFTLATISPTDYIDLSSGQVNIALRNYGGPDMGAELVIWEGTDRTGTELYRGPELTNLSGGPNNKTWSSITGIGATEQISSLYFQINFREFNGSMDGGFNNLFVDGAVVPVPEPSTYALFAGFLALGGVMLRRRLRD